MKPLRMALLALAGSAFAAGCAASPKYIAASTARPAEVKFLYVKQGGGQGIIKCARAADGALDNCRRVTVVLEAE